MVKNPSFDIEPSQGAEMGLETSSEVTPPASSEERCSAHPTVGRPLSPN